MRKTNRLTPRAKEAVREALGPLVVSIKQKSSALYKQCERSFEQTGFTREVWESEECCLVEGDEEPAGPWEAWDILPPQYVASKLYHVDEAIDRLNEAIKAGPTDIF